MLMQVMHNAVEEKKRNTHTTTPPPPTPTYTQLHSLSHTLNRLPLWAGCPRPCRCVSLCACACLCVRVCVWVRHKGRTVDLGSVLSGVCFPVALSPFFAPKCRNSRANTGGTRNINYGRAPFTLSVLQCGPRNPAQR